METNLLGMKSSVLLKLTYLQLQLDNPHSAVRSADELLLMPSLPSTESNK